MNESLVIPILLFLASAVVIGVAGVHLTIQAERLALQTQVGQIFMGAVVLGALTSLSGSITSLAAALHGHADLAISNAVGGINVQLVFLAFADIAYRKANLEHAAASQENLMQTSLLILLMLFPLLAICIPSVTILNIHPISFVMFAVYLFGIRLVSQSKNSPMWKPILTRETKVEKTKAPKKQKSSMLKAWLILLVTAVAVGGAGAVLSRSAVEISQASGLSKNFIGTFLTAVTTSMPELVVALIAVRRGALALAMGDIVGGNMFDTLILAVSDIAYQSGSIYHQMTQDHFFILILGTIMSAILLMGLIRREKHGFANIGLESLGIMVCYLGSLLYFIF